MDRRILKLMLGAAVVVAALPAAAQETKPVGLSVRAGMLFPASGYGRDVGNAWFGAGAEFKVKDLGFGTMDRGMMSSLSVSIDWYGKGEASSVPVMLNYVGTQNEFYWTAGAGFSFTRDAPGGVGRNKTNMAYTVGVGYNFQKSQMPLFVEGRFMGNGNSNLNAFGAYIGVRL